MHNFKKQFGQNFLRNKGAANKLVESLDLRSEDTLIEIGPGNGSVTDLLIDKVKRLILVEIDQTLIPTLKEKYNAHNNVELVNENILDFKGTNYGLSSMDYKLVGSLPYNISKPIIKKFLTEEPRPSKMSFIIQKEVAEDYASKAPRAAFLSNFSTIYSDIKYLGTISKKDFYPQPKVDGGMLKFEIRKKKIEKGKELSKFIRVGYSSPRKVLINNLSNVYPKEKVASTFKKLEINPKARAAEIEFEGWIELFRILGN